MKCIQKEFFSFVVLYTFNGFFQGAYIIVSNVMKRLENAEQKHSNECCFNLVEIVMSAFSIHIKKHI